jgi:hypothetical protein
VSERSGRGASLIEVVSPCFLVHVTCRLRSTSYALTCAGPPNSKPVEAGREN